MTASGTLQPGETVKFDDFWGTSAADLEKGAFEKRNVLMNQFVEERARIRFGQDTIVSLKEKQKQEKAAKKKLPKNFKPQDH